MVDATGEGSTGTALDFLRFPDFSPLLGTKAMDRLPFTFRGWSWRRDSSHRGIVGNAIASRGHRQDRPEARKSPPSRELSAQGIGNVTCGMLVVFR